MRCSPLPAQDLNPISPLPDNPFAQPLNLSTLLLSQIDSLESNLATLGPKIAALQTLSDEQAQRISDLLISTADLSRAIADSQASSLRLQALLDQSEATRAMQEGQLRASTISLNDSQTALQAAQGDVRALGTENTMLKWIAGICAGAAALLGGYLGGHALAWW